MILKQDLISYIPWTRILEFGALVFHPRRTAENLRDKWRNFCKKRASDAADGTGTALHHSL
ncbi:unnamed protein product [Rhodiola kirilowii]